jgi:ATPase subunit of ABC transporter with duplicated ATPase domains
MTDHTKTIIEFKHVSFGYTSEYILKDVSFAIHEGDYIGIIGPNGGLGDIRIIIRIIANHLIDQLRNF